MFPLESFLAIGLPVKSLIRVPRGKKMETDMDTGFVWIVILIVILRPNRYLMHQTFCL